ncbi:MAG TPA: DinB family protein [Gemmatimonadaceae bacterium]|nr:DinB family protein [Gemmatimonadaceae bacterium]
MKTARFAIVTLVAPIALSAQQPAATPTSNPITASFKARINNLNHNVAQALDSIPESKFSYRPTPAQMTIGDIAQHVADDNYFFCNTFGAMKGTRPADETSTPDSVKAKWPKAKLMSSLRESFAFCDKAIAEVDDKTLADQVTITFGGNSRSVTRSGMVLLHALDLADHYSQLANYMRLNNILPPTALPRAR